MIDVQLYEEGRESERSDVAETDLNELASDGWTGSDFYN